MAKKGYPGLVVVPPSDRSILKRRLLHAAFIIIAIAWGVSTSKVWIPSLNNNADCKAEIGQVTSANSPKGCDQPEQPIAETPSHLGELSIAEASHGKSLAESYGPVPSPHIDQLATHHFSGQEPKAKPFVPATSSSDHAISSPSRNEVKAASANNKTEPGPSPDIRLAEKGDAFAQYRLGRFYAQLSGPKAPESMSWYSKASDGLQRMAEAGNGQAMYVLGVMYAYGRGVTRDQEQARLWLARAVDQQVPEAHMVLAKLDGHPERRLQVADETPSEGPAEIVAKPISTHPELKQLSAKKRSTTHTILTDFPHSR